MRQVGSMLKRGNHSASALMDTLRLDIYVESGCVGCDRAAEVADWVRAHYPGVTVRLLRPGEGPGEQARAIRATPSYFLNGKQVYLGNPGPEQLRAMLGNPAGGESSP